MNRVILTFEKTLTNLAGYDYGKSIYYDQVKGKIRMDEEVEIVFPPQIRGVASSFVQGFFEDIVDNVGLIETEKKVHIISENDGFRKMVMSKLQ